MNAARRRRKALQERIKVRLGGLAGAVAEAYMRHVKENPIIVPQKQKPSPSPVTAYVYLLGDTGCLRVELPAKNLTKRIEDMHESGFWCKQGDCITYVSPRQIKNVNIYSLGL